MIALKHRPLAAGALLGLLALSACQLESRDDYLGDKDPRHFGLGREVSAAEIAPLDIDVSPNGAGLPAGSGTPAQGASIFAGACASCHGADGEGKPPAYPQLVGGPKGAVNFDSDYKIPRTIGNYWPYATTLYGYIRRAMPLTAPGSLTPDQTYAVTAYLLSREGIVPDGTTLDAKSLAAIQMPARSRFVPDDRRGSSGGANVR
jgi:cytochrome c